MAVARGEPSWAGTGFEPVAPAYEAGEVPSSSNPPSRSGAIDPNGTELSVG
jgi:hypothetical protein